MNLRKMTLPALAATALVFALGCGQASPASADSANGVAVPQTTVVVTLLHNKLVHAGPALSSKVVGYVADTRPLTGETTVLPVIARSRISGRTWLEVRLPQRPDGATGWITATGAYPGRDPWYIVVSRALRQASIYKSGQLVEQFPVIVGKPSTPTPAGQFFVAETLSLGYGVVAGPYALATSAYSNVYQEFEGGPGQIALHGIVGLGDPLGTAASHGCVRFADADITWLAERVPIGTPIDII